MPPTRATKEIGETGLDEWSGVIREEFRNELRGREGYKKYNEMRLNSPVIGALLLSIEMPLRQIKWQFTSEVEEDKRIEFLNENLKVMSHSLNDHVVEALTMLPFGFSIFEIVYQRNNSQLMWRKFAIRGQETVHRWLFDDEGGLAGFEQATKRTRQAVPIPIEKSILYRTRVERNNPEGRSILRSAYIPYYYAKHISEIEAIGIERDLAGLPMIELPEGADPTESDADTTDYGRANKIVRNIRNDEQAGIVVPFGWKVSLLSSGGGKQFNTDVVINRYETRMLMSALSQFLMLGQEKVGSLALSKDQTDFFNISLNATADIIADTITKYAIPRLLKLNGMDPDGMKLEHSPAGDVDIESLSNFLSRMRPYITWTPSDEIWLRQTAKLPERSVEEIEEGKEKKAEVARQIFRRRQGKEEEELEAKIQEAYEQYEGEAPDDEERIRWEKRWRKIIAKFFQEQKARILKGARSLRRGS